MLAPPAMWISTALGCGMLAHNAGHRSTLDHGQVDFMKAAAKPLTGSHVLTIDANTYRMRGEHGPLREAKLTQMPIRTPASELENQTEDESKKPAGSIAKTVHIEEEYEPKVLEAYEAFEDRHEHRGHLARRLLVSLDASNPTSIAIAHQFDRARIEVARNRFFMSEALGTVNTYKSNRKTKTKWKLQTSIWAPRAKWCESKDFWEREEVEKNMFNLDWKRCCECGIGRFILRTDDGNGSNMGDEEAHADEVTQVESVLWAHHLTVNALFDYYATVGASNDVTHMGPNAFSQFVIDCRLANKNSSFCKSTHFDQLFIAADASSAGGKTKEVHNRKKALNRQEFMQCLVKIGCMRYVQDGTIAVVSTALERLFLADIEPRLDPKVFAPSNNFRTSNCYVESTDDVLRKHEASLRLIFERACKLDGQDLSKGIANAMVSYASWKEVCKRFELVNLDLTERDVTLAFTMSRMRASDEQLDKSRILLTHLSFEDFLEAVCRLAARKAFPTAQEIQDVGDDRITNAGQYLIRLRELAPDEHDSLIRARQQAWGLEPLQPFSLCIDHMCSLLMATCQSLAARAGGGVDSLSVSGRSVNEKEVAAALKIGGAR